LTKVVSVINYWQYIWAVADLSCLADFSEHHFNRYLSNQFEQLDTQVSQHVWHRLNYW